MNPLHRPWGLRRACWRLLPLAVLLSSLPAYTLAQEELTDTELESLYLAARSEHQSALELLAFLESRHNRALQEFVQARDSGSGERRNAAFTELQTLSGEIRSQERRVGELEEGLTEARRRYKLALRASLDSLLAARARARAPEDSVSLAIRFVDTNNRYQALSLEEDDPAVGAERVSVLIRDLRDGPEDLRRRAAQEDYRAEQYQSLLQEIDLRLGELREDRARDRTARDFMTGLDRYGDTRLPVVPPGSRTGPERTSGQGAPGADTTGAGGRSLTLEERIQNLETQRGLALERIGEALGNAAQYRRWAGGSGA